MAFRIKLTKKEIEDIESFEVLSKIFHYNYNQNHQLFNKSQRVLHNFFIIVGDIDNGGFIQFFQNTNEEFFKSGLDAFKLIRDLKTHKILSEAIKIYYRNEPFLSAKDLRAPFEDTKDAKRLEELDNAFYKMDEQREKKLKSYVKKHIGDFVEVARL